jgi:hypothetical protein
MMNLQERNARTIDAKSFTAAAWLVKAEDLYASVGRGVDRSKAPVLILDGHRGRCAHCLTQSDVNDEMLRSAQQYHQMAFL